ncbi:MAG: methyltransferase domain-containing protein [Myxococcales bacterium]|nr:methyltransferase domain-containing protein [Myxococcales bacterium]
MRDRLGPPRRRWSSWGGGSLSLPIDLRHHRDRITVAAAHCPNTLGVRVESVSMAVNPYDSLVASHGLSATQKQAIAWVPEGSRVLELGCAGGYIGEILMRQRGCSVDALEIDAASAELARTRGLTVWQGSLDDMAFVNGALEGRSYDAIVATDVLEHLREPELVLAAMHRWLAPGGVAIVAVPNIAAWSMRVQLGVRGNFDYEDTGQLDRTHLRFYTWESFIALVKSQGWRIEETMADSWELPGLQRLMFELPRALRTRLLDGQAAEPTGTAGRIFHGAGRVLRLHQRVANRLGPLRPNLCATHVALRIRSAR